MRQRHSDSQPEICTISKRHLLLNKMTTEAGLWNAVVKLHKTMFSNPLLTMPCQNLKCQAKRCRYHNLTASCSTMQPTSFCGWAQKKLACHIYEFTSSPFALLDSFIPDTSLQTLSSKTASLTHSSSTAMCRSSHFTVYLVLFHKSPTTA